MKQAPTYIAKVPLLADSSEMLNRSTIGTSTARLTQKPSQLSIPFTGQYKKNIKRKFVSLAGPQSIAPNPKTAVVGHKPSFMSLSHS